MWAWVAKTTWYWKIQILQVGSRFRFLHYLLNCQHCLEIWMKSQEKQRYIHLFLRYKNSNSSNIDWDWLINLMLFYKHLKVSVFGVILVRIWSYSDCILRIHAVKYRPEQLRIRTIFTQNITNEKHNQFTNFAQNLNMIYCI